MRYRGPLAEIQGEARARSASDESKVSIQVSLICFWCIEVGGLGEKIFLRDKNFAEI